MPREETLTTGLRVAIATASAAVTVAVVVTLGAISGYVRPPSLEPAFEAAATSEAAPLASQQVVLVPVQPRAEAPTAVASLEPELAPTVERRADDDDWDREHEGREHREHRRDRDRDDDEEDHDDD